MQNSPSPQTPVASAIDPGDQRRLGVVAERRLQAPGPVLRLVEEQVGGVEPSATRREQQQAAEREPRASRRHSSRLVAGGRSRCRCVTSARIAALLHVVP